ncbi:hypothetical protein EZJ43_03060 [Pedobacter changchengzhani]|uniref:Uncharacterized protein n=1 Tax=Pedobacter changchengzhani TaxID=2529274 RepID=A0A4R5MP40_9SPHI|nr:hypothetical protein [Pedobacter changchengzhani]TDG37115.1 hypothetical protein EZJ43_03060 [Pedobacter changchengzhani]
MYQKFICYRLNPNEQELGGEVSLHKNVNGRIFINCRLDVRDHTAILIDEDDEIKAVLSLHHFYLLNVY